MDKFSPYSTIEDEHHHEFTLTFARSQADTRDVAFYIKNKKVIAKFNVKSKRPSRTTYNITGLEYVD